MSHAAVLSSEAACLLVSLALAAGFVRLLTFEPCHSQLLRLLVLLLRSVVLTSPRRPLPESVVTYDRLH